MPATATPPKQDRELLRVSEAATLVGIAEGESKTEDGTVLVHLMRPCLGKGKGRHIYEADMLERHGNGGHFDDWPMFVDHDSPQARRAAGGLPRSLRDVGGRVVRSWWDPTVEADATQGLGQGAVVAEVKPVPWVHELIEHDPKLVNVSLNTYATGVRPTRRGGRSAYVVEGFAPTGSADWVTKPGAGGKVVELLEAAVEEGGTPDVLGSLSDDSLIEWLHNERPAVAESLTNPEPDHGEEDDMDRAEIAEAALDALRSDDGKAAIAEVVAEAAEDAVKSVLETVLPPAIGRAAEVIEQRAGQVADQAVRAGRLGERAAGKIAEAKLPDSFAEDLRSRYERPEFADVVDEESGQVTESAEELLDRAVEADIAHTKELIGSINPTAVSDAGGGSSEDAGEGVAEAGVTGELGHQLQEAGIDAEAAYGLSKPGSSKDSDKDPSTREPEPATA